MASPDAPKPVDRRKTARAPSTGLLSSSIARRTVILVVLAVALIQTAAEIWDVAQQRRASIATLERQVALTTVVAARGIARPLAEGDMGQVENLFAALRSHPDFVDVLLVDERGALLAALTSDPARPGARTVERRSLVEFVDGGTRRELGVVSVRFDRANVTQGIGSLVAMHIASGLLVVIGVVTALFFVTRSVTAPLALIRRTIEGLEAGDTSRRIETMALASEHREVRAVAEAVERVREGAREIEEIRRSDDRINREERRRIRAALESTQDAAIILRENGHVAFQNAVARSLLGSALTDVVPTLDMIADDGDRARVLCAIMERTGAELTTMVRGSKGETVPVRLRVNPIYDADTLYLGAVLLATDISDEVRSAERIRHLAEHDSLTGLKNRRLLEEEIGRHSEEGTEDLALMLLDLDRFKQINDTLGHPVGDALLIHVAALLEDMIGEGDLTARLGGDEFAVLLTGDEAGLRARVMAGEIVGTLSEPVTVSGRQLRSGASIGIARLGPDRFEVTDAFRHADLALYEAKRNGRGCFVEFEETLEREVRRSARIESALSPALAAGALECVYQPQVNLATGEITTFEALARWTDPELGAVPPREFVAVAEDTRQIGEMTRQVIATAAAAANDWRAQGFGNLRVGINLSPRLLTPTLPELIDDALLAAGASADVLDLEVPDGAFLSEGVEGREALSRLRGRGVRITLDGFGRGQASLAALKGAPIDRLKITPGFVDHLGRGADVQGALEALVALGHALGLEVLGEAVETEEQLAALRAANADVAQGFIFGVPLDAGDVPGELTTRRKQNA
ncbi:MAG: EAL domain-containing protein [Pseudomonadota bacterium]